MFRLALILALFAPPSQAVDRHVCLRWIASASMEGFYHVTKLRYRTRVVSGLQHLKPVAGRGTLVLANHPSYTDPALLVSLLNHYRFPVTPVIKQAETNGPFGWLAVNVPPSVVLPTFEAGTERRNVVEGMKLAIEKMSTVLQARGNLLLYPSGRITRVDGFEEMENKGAVQRLMRANPETRVLLVRMDGMFGSRFGYQPDYEPELMPAFTEAMTVLARRGVFFAPKREINLTIQDLSDVTANEERGGIEDKLNAFFNNPPQSPVSVPY